MSASEPAQPFRTSSQPENGLAALLLTRIDRYELIYRLGTGGMGNVYLARRRNESGLQRLFAVKAMHALLSADAEFANMFLDEAHIASKLHHGNVVGIVDLGRDAGRLYMVMDYVEGPTLGQLLAASAEHPPALVCTVVIDMLHGLHAAHCLTNEKGERLELVHRDVSPSNILVGTDGVARLTDFGIAKARVRRTNTSPGVRKGKLSYSAPEQITNPGSEDARVDVFAAGVVLWNALTGKRLFEGDNEAAVILRVVSAEIPPPSTVGLRPPPCLDEVCLRALCRDPAGRYSSAAEMADDLRRVTRENDLVAGPEKVADWVATIFTEERERRRAAIRRMWTISEEPDVGAAAFARGTEPQRPELESAYTELSVSWSRSGLQPPPEPAPRPGRWTWTWNWNWTWALRGVAVAMVVAAAVTALHIAFRDEDSSASAGEGARMRERARPRLPAAVSAPAIETSMIPAAVTPPTDVSSPAPATSVSPDSRSVTVPAEGPPPNVETSPETPSPPEPRAERRHRQSKPATRQRTPSAAAASGSPTQPEPPVAAPAPTPASAPPSPATEAIESNPYLRRSAQDR